MTAIIRKSFSYEWYGSPFLPRHLMVSLSSEKAAIVIPFTIWSRKCSYCFEDEMSFYSLDAAIGAESC